MTSSADKLPVPTISNSKNRNAVVFAIGFVRRLSVGSDLQVGRVDSA